MKYYNTITAISVGPGTENPVFGEVIHIKLDDECGGMFLVFEQDGFDDKANQVRIGIEEWNNVCQAVALLTKQPLFK